MRTLALLLLLAATAPALADVAGTYDVQFEEAAGSCPAKPETFAKGSVVITVKKSTLTVKFDKIFQMVGAAPKDDKINAKTKNLIGTSMMGLSARYSVAGRADGTNVELVVTAQYIRQDTYKPHCQQVWNVKGTRR